MRCGDQREVELPDNPARRGDFADRGAGGVAEEDVARRELLARKNRDALLVVAPDFAEVGVQLDQRVVGAEQDMAVREELQVERELDPELVRQLAAGNFCDAVEAGVVLCHNEAIWKRFHALLFGCLTAEQACLDHLAGWDFVFPNQENQSVGGLVDRLILRPVNRT